MPKGVRKLDNGYSVSQWVQEHNREFFCKKLLENSLMEKLHYIINMVIVFNGNKKRITVIKHQIANDRKVLQNL